MPAQLPDDLQNLAPCPNCKSRNAEKMKFTFWGLYLGPRLLNHVKCKNCGTEYNGVSGKSNLVSIIIFVLIEIGVIIGLGILLKSNLG